MRLMRETDEDLWRKCIAGDADAFGVLFDRHADAVFRYCLSRCGSWHDAEELVSITFLEAWRQRNRLRPERDTVLPWLLGVATNANRNRARGSRRHANFLCLMNGVGQEEAATTLGVRIETVKSRLHRARAKLATMKRDLEPAEQLDTPIVEARLS
jgi:RNA polymerase sigma-70 factor (ECF subfamily)